MGGHVGGRTRLVARFEIAVVLGGLLAIAGAEAWKGQVAVESVDKPSDQLGLGGQAWVDPLQACVTRDITCSLLVAIRLVMAPAVVMMTMMVVAVAVVTMMMTMFAITITITIAITAIVRHTKCLPHDCRQSQTAPLLVVVALTSHREGEECLKEQEARTGSRSTRHPHHSRLLEREGRTQQCLGRLCFHPADQPLQLRAGLQAPGGERRHITSERVGRDAAADRKSVV